MTPIATDTDPPVEHARKALANQLGIAPENIHVQTVTPMEWPDSSLGCPREGGYYMPVVTRGHRVVLEAGGRSYSVHVAGSTTVVCRDDSLGKPKMITAPRFAEMARRDLAARLKIDPSAIKTSFTRPQTWTDASLGCPEPGIAYEQVLTPGFVIELEAQGRKYRYHASLERIVSCDDQYR